MFDYLTNKKCDIIIAAGQSNCKGSGIGYVEFPYEPKENVWAYYLNGKLLTATEGMVENQYVGGSFVLKFADRYLADGFLEEDRQLVIIQCAVGATGFTPHHPKGNWTKEGDLSASMFRMTREILSLNPDNKIIAFLWHQGEHEVVNNRSHDLHFSNMYTLLNDVKEAFGDEFPFILGDLVPRWKEERGEAATIICETNREIAGFFNGYFVTSEGLLSNAAIVPKGHSKENDTVHFSRPSLYELGERYYEKFLLHKNKSI